MDNSSDDPAPNPPTRKSGKPVPPFVAPRTGEHPVTPASKPRRSTPMFVPPTPAPVDELDLEMDPVLEATPNPDLVDHSAAEALPAPPPAAAPRETRGLELEHLEVEGIDLHITGERPAIGDSEIDVIAYDDANGELDAKAKGDKRPSVDGLELESTELSLEPSGHVTSPPAGLEIESFWAAEAFTPSASKSTEPPRRPSGPSAPAFADPSGEPPIARASSAMDALRVEEVLPPRMPTPQSNRAVAPAPARVSAGVSLPKGMTPIEVRTPRQLESVKELEPWGVPSVAPAVAVSDIVADALERVARKIRQGDLKVPPDASASSDENSLSAALQALVRAPRR